MKVIVDNKIPFIRDALERLVDEVIYKPGAEICREDVRDADALIVRTRTNCNAELLEGSKVSFIATATIGYDHLDTAYLSQAGIAWANCPGCNANSVGQYIRSCMLLLEKEKGYDLSRTTVGIVGVGHVGQAVIRTIEPLGVHILQNDPPVKEQLMLSGLPTGHLKELNELQKHCDIISFHTPLTRSGHFPTYHLADKTFFDGLEKHPVIINTGRGPVADDDALYEALLDGRVKDAIIDTWENEPQISLPLLQRAYIGTPHIAGYSADGKANATRMALTAFCRHFGLPATFEINVPRLPSGTAPDPHLPEKELALALYNPHSDSEKLKSHPERFEEFRGNYPVRRETLE